MSSPDALSEEALSLVSEKHAKGSTLPLSFSTPTTSSSHLNGSLPMPVPSQSMKSVVSTSGQSHSSANRFSMLLQTLPIFQCPVSSLPFEFTGPRTPRCLRQCGHTFSEEVLLTLRGTAGSVVCPVCQVETHLREAAGEAFYINKPLLSTMKGLREQYASLSQPPQCENCSSPVTLNCPDCEAQLCSPCFASIHAVGLLKRHQPTPFSSDSLRGEIFCNRCPKHPKYFNEFVCLEKGCKDYKKICCPMCERELHKNHATELIGVVAKVERKRLDEQLKSLLARADRSNSVLIRVLETSAAISPEHDDEDESGHEAHKQGTEQAAIQRIHQFFDEIRSRLAAREQKLVDAVAALAKKKKHELAAQAKEIAEFVAASYKASLGATVLLQKQDDSEFMGRIGETAEQLQAVDAHQFMMLPRMTDLINVSLDPNFVRHIDSLGRVEDDGLVAAPQPYNSFESTLDLVIAIPSRERPSYDEGEEAFLQIQDSEHSRDAPATIPSIRFQRWSDKLVVTNDYRTVSKHIPGKKSNMFCTLPLTNSYSVRVDDLPAAGNNWVVGWADPAFPLDGWERGIPCAIMAAYDGVPYSSGGVAKLPIRHSSIQAPFSLQKGSIVHSFYDEEKHTVSFAVNDEEPQVLLSNVTGELYPFLRIHSVGVVLTLM